MGTAGPKMLPGANNTYVENAGASNFLVTQFSRNVVDFPLNRYVQLMPGIPQSSGYYLRLDVEQSGRITDGTMNQFIWPDGSDRPRRNQSLNKYNWVRFETNRYNFDFTIGYKSKNQADFNVEDIAEADEAQLAMTARTRRVHAMLETESLWDSSHISNAADISGNTGTWAESTTARMDIKRSINYMVNQIRKDTLAAVKSKRDMHLVMNPTTAQRISENQELVNAIIQSPDSFNHFQGKEVDYDNYGLPPRIYGLDVVVEDTVMVTSPRNASTLVTEDVCEDGVVYLLSRPGKLTARSTSRSVNFSTVMMFLYEDMNVESFDDNINRRFHGDIVDDTAEELTAPVSGFRLKNVV